MTQNEETLSERIRALHARVAHLCLEPGKGIDTMRMIQIYAGMVCELLLEYELPGEMMASFEDDLMQALNIDSLPHFDDKAKTLPPVYILDREIEFGRSFAREITMEEWDDVHDALKTLSNLLAHDFTLWEMHHMRRAESFVLFHECLKLALAFEFAAQDLCDILIEEKIAKEEWTLGDCISAMSAVSGWYAGSHYGHISDKSIEAIERMDQVIFIMTQESFRLGVEGSANWRKGLPANDTPINPPMDLIEEANPLIRKYTDFIQIDDESYIGAMIAKASGRMIAVACGGDFPEIEPAIAKPLAMMALLEAFRYQDQKRQVS
ncbi:MAG: hypothetical protein CMH30_00135 [Micavibrio sp.]|nr:hypothetical protein [Micavibrio sp.]|tara:strand:- start:128 stop:1093 length:966 start_codon:yes stop_codon:yes gene_type:complete